MNKHLNYFKKIIESKGNKFTVQKIIILKVLMESKIHLNAEQIWEMVKESNIGISTVYRSLKLFTELKILKEININGISYYEMKMFSRKPLHIHFKCLECGSIIDIDSSKLDLEYLKLNKKIEEDNDLDIHDLNITLVGLCAKCKEEQKCQDQQNLDE